MTPKYKRGEKLRIVGNVWGTSSEYQIRWKGYEFIVGEMRENNTRSAPNEPLYVFEPNWSVQESAVVPVGGGFKRWAQQFK